MRGLWISLRERGGETIEVTHHGTTVAVLSPAEPDRISRLIASGQATAGQRGWRRFGATR